MRRAAVVSLSHPDGWEDRFVHLKRDDESDDDFDARIEFYASEEQARLYMQAAVHRKRNAVKVLVEPAFVVEDVEERDRNDGTD
jgi:hypothetical protein